MPLSISSFEERAAVRSYAGPIVWAIATIVLLLCSFEIVARIGFSHISRIESRTSKDHAAALAVRHSNDSRPSILLLGGSLLLEALDYDRIRTALQKDAVPTRFVIEQTAWLDWYYGIRRLFAEGSRPDRLVLCLDIHQLLDHSLRGEYSAFYLIQTGDLAEAGRSAGYNLSRTSNLFFARYSLFYAGLNNFRNFVLNRLAPRYAETLRSFRIGPVPPLSDADVLAGVSPRLASLQALCSQYHTRCDILVPPGLVPSGDHGLIEAGEKTGTTIMIPVPVNAWGNEMFLGDHYHLNPDGARRFTDLLAKALQQP